MPKAEFAWEQAMESMMADPTSSAYKAYGMLSEDHAQDLVLMQEAARAKGGHAVRALERLTQRAMAGAKAGAQGSGSLPPSRLECSCRFADESNALDNPPEA
ncbi:hypothetical protein FNF27_02725 [Cafeteria roenbergensis]|uniref:Uncharacterized protein n=2 Tax=Cafeteria roenbergensis TaxID=33653 RepID=A0A5A8ECH6_CAFRO|nr:hypothetical protein FNF29_03101 [Cafeteria roenbergensis]KAA0162420.1 hypothetical protein FNF31_03219 [Cafeteria roenbergensis]KAA0170438.1 hypothetical protein FNF28_01432 [Cafeteria roenbergensis]KAA0175643.1 hypothetical protein FNF27_02725 [Cafeteria roenbergensis]|eukprot:KAA0153287.1 hypothetical protein FNF29_03101 [Cafeteria roenbergensis]